MVQHVLDNSRKLGRVSAATEEDVEEEEENLCSSFALHTQFCRTEETRGLRVSHPGFTARLSALTLDVSDCFFLPPSKLR